MTEEKLFICYQSGLGMKIVPRNAAGWRAFALWMLLFFAFTALYVVFAEIWWTLILYLTATVIWTVAMIMWMKARSEIVDMDELLNLKKELDATKRRK